MTEEPEALGKKDTTDLVICIFPHQKEFITVDAAGAEHPSVNVRVLDAGAIFTEQFYSGLQDRFANLLISKRETPFIGMMELSQEVELLIREQGLAAILKAVQDTLGSHGGSVSMVLCTGPILLYTQAQITELFRSALGDKATPESLELCARVFEKLRQAEKASLAQVQAKYTEEVTQGEGESFFTLWQNKG